MLAHQLRNFFSFDLEFDKDSLDIADAEAVKEAFSRIKPTIVINAAGYTNVDGAEDNKEAALTANYAGVRNIVDNLGDAILVHYSTDYVFDGSKKEGYDEGDIQNPINYYGFSKAEGERYIIKNCKKYYLIRTSWLFGENGKNFVDTINGLKSHPKVVNDQFGRPTYTKDLAMATKALMAEPFGIYHITNSGSCTWFDFAKAIREDAMPCSSEEYPQKAKRPKYSILNNNKTKELRSWQEALKEFMR